jgi:hypothetical protein
MSIMQEKLNRGEAAASFLANTNPTEKLRQDLQAAAKEKK